VGAAGSLWLRNDETEPYDNILQYIFTVENIPVPEKRDAGGTK